MVTTRFRGAVGALLLPTLLATTGCEPTRRTLVISEDMRKLTRPATPEAPRTDEKAPLPPAVYTMRLAENGRVWEVDLPESSGGYQVRVPLTGGMDGLPEMPTAADQQLLSGTGAPSEPDAVKDGRAVDARQQALKRSYLGGLARVNELYRTRRYELALIELVQLEQSFPEDSRLLAMKGSLLVRLRRLPQAREAYEKSLALNPDDIGVAEALRELAESGE